MQVQSVNNNTTFNGRVIIKNKSYMPNLIMKALVPVKETAETKAVYADFLQKMSEGNDVIVRLKTKSGDKFGKLFTGVSEYYNLSFSVLKENSTIDKILDTLRLKKRKNLARVYHTENGIATRLDNPEYTDKLLSQFAIV